jgi:hypothetical protein
MSDPEPLSLFEQPEATIPERGMEKPIKPAVRMIAPPTPTAHTGPVVITPIDEAPLRAQDSLWVATPPPYVRPTMTEALSAEPTGLKAVGSFSGCGGSSLGLRMAGIEVKYAIEFIPAAADVYEANLPGTIVDRRDIRNIKPEEILEEVGLRRGDLDIFEGSPPCLAPRSLPLASERSSGVLKRSTATRSKGRTICSGSGRACWTGYTRERSSPRTCRGC